MEIFTYPDRAAWADLCSRACQNENEALRSTVRNIIGRVRENGDKALRELALEIDGRLPEYFEAGEAQFEAARNALDSGLKRAIAAAAENIRRFHAAQQPRTIEVETAPGVRCIQKPVPIGKVGLYIPGGTAPLFSTVLMLAIPAKLAGCSEIVLCTPAGKDGKIAPAVLYTAHFCGIDRVFCTGGAQAIAAMAYGTETIPRVDKIFGPGNRYVTTAKQMLGASIVAIDMPAGPSEVMVIADADADAAFVAADLLSQAEHGRDSQVMLVTDSEAKAGEVQAEVERQIRTLGRAELAQGALSHSRTVILESEGEIIDFANAYAPEHLIVNTKDPWRICSHIYAAGSVFVGPYTPESAGDYASGTNHTRPTSAWARAYSGVNLDSFMRRMTLQEISRDGLRNLSETIVTMAEAEGLQAHANAVKVRSNE
ncbi:MAG: histidinol dehydrogenase [Bacteroidales bacterium]|nr:histidinol dehydrogenase [Bacteroidales bacterium]